MLGYEFYPWSQPSPQPKNFGGERYDSSKKEIDAKSRQGFVNIDL